MQTIGSSDFRAEFSSRYGSQNTLCLWMALTTITSSHAGGLSYLEDWTVTWHVFSPVCHASEPFVQSLPQQVALRKKTLCRL